jgi:PAS domain S-box-containing protein
MAGFTIDYEEVFRALPGAVALMTSDGVILDVNDSYLEVAGRELAEVRGRNIFEAFPGNPRDPGESGPGMLRTSLEAVVSTGERDVMPPIRYDVEDRGRPGEFEERYWFVVNTPLLDEDGRVALIVHKADEITHVILQARNLLADHG